MTAISVIRRPDTVWFLTDAACYDADGVIMRVESKVIALPEIRAAIAMRGPYEAMFILRHMMGAARGHLASFDQLIDELPAIVRAATQRYHRSRSELMVGGYSNRGQEMQTFLCFSEGGQRARLRDGSVSEVPATTPVRIPDMVGAPAPTQPQMAIAGLHGLLSPATFDPAAHAGKMLDAQRLCRSDAGWYMVGGYGELTTVTKEGVTSQIVRRWNDRVGGKINITGGFVEGEGITVPAGLNRKQRRALAAIGDR